MVIKDDALIQNGLGDTDRGPEADGLGPEAWMLASAVIGQRVVDLALVDQERILFVATGLGDGWTLSAVEKHAAAQAASGTAAGLPLLGGVGVDGNPAAQGFGEPAVRVLSGFCVAQKQTFKFRILCEVVSGLEDSFPSALGLVDDQQDPGVVVADEVVRGFLHRPVLDSKAEDTFLSPARSRIMYSL